MLEELKNSLNKIESSKEFVKWKKEHRKGYFTSIFLSDDIWQFDFLDPESGMMASFKIVDDDIFYDESEIFRKGRKKVEELDMNDIKIDLEKAENIALKSMDKDFNKEEIQKKFAVVQVLKGPIWNMTYITKSLNVLNIKIDAVKGSVIDHSLESLLNYKK